MPPRARSRSIRKSATTEPARSSITSWTATSRLPSPGGRAVSSGGGYTSSPQPGCSPVAWIVKLVEQAVDRRQHVVDADQRAPLQRPPRMVQSEDQALVHVLRRAHSLADRERGLVHQLAHDPPQHEAGHLGNPLGVETERAEEVLDRLVVLAGELDEAARLEGRQEVEAGSRPAPQRP